MKKQLISVSQLKAKHPRLKNFISSGLNEKIYRYLCFFVTDKSLLIASLIQNPLGKTRNLPKIKKTFGQEIFSPLLILGRMHDHDPKILKKYSDYKPVVILFLANFKIIFDTYSPKKISQMFSPRTLRYAMRLLEKNDITELRLALEDNFFSLLEPQIYRSYLSLLKFTRKKFNLRQKEILKNFHKMMDQSHIQAKIEGRLKTIYSIHNKIIKKNILFSQILDAIGIRMIVADEENCYRCMASILKNYPIMTSRVKDYIAVPKENGYKSIHLTILYENYPVEIQIRTQAMHAQAQFGDASHASYKKS